MEDSKFQRKIEIKDSVIKGLIEKRGEISKTGLEIAQKMVKLAKEHAELEEQHDKLLQDVNKLKLRILKIAQKNCSKQLGEFESPVTTKIEDGKVFLYVANELAEWKDARKAHDPWKYAIPTKKK